MLDTAGGGVFGGTGEVLKEVDAAADAGPVTLDGVVPAPTEEERGPPLLRVSRVVR